MKLWLISQKENTGYDTYDSAVVMAATADEARMMHPYGDEWDGKEDSWGTWADADKVRVEEIGLASPSLGPSPKVICASFNAG